jgi:hypothetical protein
MYGRLRLYLACNVLFVAFTVACAVSTNLNMLIGFRFIVGCSGPTPLTLAAGTIEQEWCDHVVPGHGPTARPHHQPRHRRLPQPSLRLAQDLLAACHHRQRGHGHGRARHVRDARAARAMRRATRCCARGLRPRALFVCGIIRTMKLLFLSPIVLALSVLTVLGYGYLCLLFTTFSDVFGGRYSFSTGMVGGRQG